MKNYWNNRFFIEDYPPTLLQNQNQRRDSTSLSGFAQPQVTEVLKNTHGTLFTGHKEVDETKARLQQNYWWPNMDSTILDFNKTCNKCQKNRTDIYPKPD
jgi:hypothetical protein